MGSGMSHRRGGALGSGQASAPGELCTFCCAAESDLRHVFTSWASVSSSEVGVTLFFL